MTFLAPWALAIGAAGALGMVLLHLVAWQRPAAYVLPTTRFIPDQRTVVSRAATRPRDLLLLAIRVLMLLAAATAFARPVMTPSRGSRVQMVMVDRSRAVADLRDVERRVKQLVAGDRPPVLLAFDTGAMLLAANGRDSLVPSVAIGSLSAALVLARRTASDLAERVDSVQLVLVSPVTRGEIDSATGWLRAQWPGGLTIERVAARTDSSNGWRLERALSLDDPLGPATHARIGGSAAAVVRLVRGPLSGADSAFARAGNMVVRWDSTAASHVSPQGLAVGDEVVVAGFGRGALPDSGRAIAHWSDGTAAAREVTIGTGCIRDVGVRAPNAGDLALHAPFQRIILQLLAPCGSHRADVIADSSTMRHVLGSSSGAAPASALRNSDAPPTPLLKWLLGAALILAIAELIVRGRMKAQVMS